MEMRISARKVKIFENPVGKKEVMHFFTLILLFAGSDACAQRLGPGLCCHWNDVTLFFKDDITQPPAEGVYVHRLYLDGAGWDRRGCKLVEPTEKVLFTSMPVIHIYAINTTAGRDSRMYQCPIYKKPRRTDLTYIATVDLKTNQNPDHWILRGVALLCDIK